MRKRWFAAIGVSALAGMSLVSLVEAFPAGMDIEAMRLVATRLQSRTQELQAIEVDLQAQASVAQQSWQGPDATNWIANLNEQTVRLRTMRANLESLAQSLAQNISAMEGAAGGAPAPRPTIRLRIPMKMKPIGE